MNTRLLALIIVTAFVSLAVFGFAAMLSEMNETYGNCLASLANNGCPMPETGPAMAIFHVSAYQAFSSAIPTLAVLLLVVLAAFLVRLEFTLQKSRLRLMEKFSRMCAAFNSIIRRMTQWFLQIERTDPALAP